MSNELTIHMRDVDHDNMTESMQHAYVLMEAAAVLTQCEGRDYASAAHKVTRKAIESLEFAASLLWVVGRSREMEREEERAEADDADSDDEAA